MGGGKRARSCCGTSTNKTKVRCCVESSVVSFTLSHFIGQTSSVSMELLGFTKGEWDQPCKLLALGLNALC